MKLKLLFCFALLSACATLNAQTLVNNMSSANGNVYAVYKKAGSYYIGGDFNYVGLGTPYAALSTISKDYPNMNFPQFNGSVYALIPDGSGGWFAGGSFTMVGGVSKSYVAHIKSNNTVDNAFTANCNSTVRALYKLSGKLYIGGSFTTVNGTTRLYAAAVNATTGALSNAWNPAPNSTVNTISAAFGADTTLWLGGYFTTINSSNLYRPYLAKVNLTNGAFVSGSVSADYIVNKLTTKGDTVFVAGDFSTLGLRTDYLASITEGSKASAQAMPYTNGQVRSIISDGNGGWYIGGSFTQIGGISRSYLAHVKQDKSVDANFTANCNSTVYSIVKDGTKLYFGGSFSTVNGTPRNYLAQVNASTGALVTSWAPSANSQVNTVAIKDSVLLAGGYFTSINNQTAYRFAVIKKTDGAVLGGYPSYNSIVQKISVLGDSIITGGNYSASAYYSPYSAKLTASNVKPDPKFPATNGIIYSVAQDASGNYYVGGSFTNIGGINQAYVAKLNPSMQVVTAWAPQVNSHVRSVAVSGSTVYIGGLFTITNGAARSYISALNTANPGGNKTWNSSVNSYVYSLISDGTSVYAGGLFTQVNGSTARGLLAKFNASGSLDGSWNPNAAGGGGSVEQLAFSGTSIIAGGSFTTVAGTSRPYLAKLNTTNGSATNWATANSYVLGLYVDGTVCYVGGYFTQLTPAGGSATSRSYVAGITIANGSINSFNPSPNSYVYAINKVGSNLFFGGQFTQFAGTARNYLASTNTSGAIQSWNPSANSTVNDINVAGSSIIVGGNFSGFQETARTYTSIIKYSTQSLATWAPVLDNVVYDVAYNSNKIFLGGAFHYINSLPRAGFAAFGLGGSLQTTNLNLTKNGSANSAYVYSLFSSGNNIYVGGDFDKAGTTVRTDFVEADISSGAGTIKPTNASVNSYVYAINVQGTNIAYGGNFTFSNYISKSYLAGIRTSNNTVLPWNPIPDSYVFDVAVNYNKIFIAGQFDNINSLSHAGAAAFNLSNGALLTWNPQLSRSGQAVYADLNSVAADSDYVYLGGNFDQVAGTPRNDAAVVSVSNAAVQSWNGSPNNIVRTIALNGKNILMGGDFGYSKGAARAYIAKIDSATGLVNTSWNPGSNGYVYALSGSGSNIYVGGNFTQLGGVSRTSLGAVSASAGTTIAFDPVIQSGGGAGTIYSLAFDDAGVLYAGGLFNTAKGSPRNNVAAFSTSSSGSLKSWNPNVNSYVYALATSGSKIFLGGAFTTINGSTIRNYFTSVNNTTGTVSSFNPNLNSYVYCLNISGSNIYAGGSFSTVNGGTTSRNYAAAYDVASGSLKSWNPTPNSYVLGIAGQTDTIYMGGYFTLVNGSTRNRLTAVKGLNGTSTLAFNPDVNNIVRNEFIAEKTLLVGGSFSQIGGVYRNGFAVFQLPGSNSPALANEGLVAQNLMKTELLKQGFAMYPNPATKTTNIKFEKALSGKVVVVVTDMNGSKVLERNYAGNYLNYIKLDLSTLNSGSYIVSVKGINNYSQQTPLIIAK